MQHRSLKDINYSILDLATIGAGQTPAETFANSLKMAQQAEQLNYSRYWFAEHHNMPNVASSATVVLIGYIAAHTKTLRVGSGGIMLPNHSPLIVAEQFGTLASLYPNRIDLGLGRAPGTDQATSYAIRGENMHAAHNFPQDVVQLQQYLSNNNEKARIRAIPGEGTNVPIWILGSSTDSAHLAAALGLPYAFASHFAPNELMNAVEIYRSNFKPSAQLRQPYMLACVNVVAADTDAAAKRLATSLQRMILGIVTNQRSPLQPPIDTMDGVWSDAQREAVMQWMRYSFVGSKETVKNGLQAFAAQTGVDEIMASSHIYDPADKLQSYQLLADVFNNN